MSDRYVVGIERQARQYYKVVHGDPDGRSAHTHLIPYWRVAISKAEAQAYVRMALCSDNFRKEFTFEDEGEKRWRLYFKRLYMPLTPGDLMEMAEPGVSEEVARLLFTPVAEGERP
jgi:hypothetical protein